ncbi:tail fiber domain-containing protein [Carboxylicivirga marina]|uniref:Tail fiber domain-containing protein n=1 Tax=Carboxylicivirga marina TaxID=2800988 RepID=A0ABS1HGC2_9BACT|nr:tail fiber domain-containing protein [Carboxylicivirga marina]MBK3516713.1 tail fiber domain-containing protein [Carboxylicivirga marina]
MAVKKSKLSVSRELGRNKRIISGVGSGATNGGGGAFGGGINISGLPLATELAGKFWVIDKEGSESPERTPFVDGLPKATFESMFELVDNEGAPYIRAKYNFTSDGEIMAFADSGQLPASIWDSLPKATTTVLGGVKVGTGLKIDANGLLSIDGELGGGVSSWNDLSDKPTWLNYGTKALFEAGHGHAWSQITSKPSTFTPSSHAHPYEPVFGKNTAFNKNFGTTSSTVAQGNDSRINNGQTAYGWGNHSSAGYALAHSHPYLGSSATAVDSDKLGGSVASEYALKDAHEYISGLWSFDVQVGTVPFLVPAAKNGRVINLNADLLDGYHSSAFPMKSEAAVITSGWTFNSSTKISAGAGIYAKTDSASAFFISRQNAAGSTRQGIYMYPSTLDVLAGGGWKMRVNGTGVRIGDNGNATEALDVNGNGKFSGKLILSSSGENLMLGYNNTYTNPYFAFYESTSRKAYIQWHGDTGLFKFYNDEVDKAFYLGATSYLTSYLGVNKTTAPTEALDVNGNILASSAVKVVSTYTSTLASNSLSFNRNSASYIDQANASGYLAFRHASVIKMRVASNGVSINGSGSAAAPTQALTVTGDILASGEVESYSDIRLKSNFKIIRNPLARLRQLKGCTYDKDDRRSAGLIAQHVQRVLPEAVRGAATKDTYLSIVDSALTGLMVEGIKAVDRKTKNNRERIERLEQENKQLKRELEKLRA